MREGQEELEELAEYIFNRTSTILGRLHTIDWESVPNGIKASYRNIVEIICRDHAWVIDGSAPLIGSVVPKTLSTPLLPVGVRDIHIEQLGLSVRTVNSLKHEHITTVGELVAKGEGGLLTLHGFGIGALREVKGSLDKLGLRDTI